MAYTGNYTAADITPIAFDFVGRVGAELANQATPIGQILVLGVLAGVLGYAFGKAGKLLKMK